jgi:hypothetical protein
MPRPYNNRKISAAREIPPAYADHPHQKPTAFEAALGFSAVPGF